ncbi:HEXXH motif-containing putative peptide modification protein [Nonomuraea angiospora]|uniref:aKG-HExxH-type peptide beta-hydroxylase n=1 Tax=Nonomuraea angiospora TaxID=46172 RepID=UPI00342C795A
MSTADGHPLVEPQAEVATRQRRRLEATLAVEVRAAALHLFGADDHEVTVALDQALDTDGDVPLYPGVYHLHRLLRAGEAHLRYSREAALELAGQATGYLRRRRADGVRRYIGRPEEGYPAACVQRALAQAPAELNRATVTSRLVPWPEVPTLERAVQLLATAWPAAHAEIDAVLAQAWYLTGHGLVGFTDFAAHGAAFVSDSREIGTPGVPAAVRLAESLLHEVTHSVCNAAAVSEPLVAASPEGKVTHVPTPLRADDRPLAGLMQQLIVLVRCAALYRRAAGAVPERVAVHARADALAGQAGQAVMTLRRYRAHLTAAGSAVVEAAARQLTEHSTAPLEVAARPAAEAPGTVVPLT